MKVIFKFCKSLCSVLTKVKDALSMEKQSKVVYRISCSCDKAYIGESKRRLETGLKEHQDACQKGTRDVVSCRACMEEPPTHQMRGHFRDQPGQMPPRTVTEGSHPYPNGSAGGHFNKDMGLELPVCWLAALRSKEGRSNQGLLMTSGDDQQQTANSSDTQ